MFGVFILECVAVELKSKNAWRKEDRRVLQGEIARAVQYRYVQGYGNIGYPAYAIEQTVPVAKRNVSARPLPTTAENVALCLAGINAAAKRQRDAAIKHYQHRRYGLATLASQEKRHYYDLKQEVLDAAIAFGYAAVAGVHAKNLRDDDGNETTEYYKLIDFGGRGFHTPICDDEAMALSPDAVIDLGDWLADAKQQGKLRIVDAVATCRDFVSAARTLHNS
jgi:hypothetical protein